MNWIPSLPIGTWAKVWAFNGPGVPSLLNGSKDGVVKREKYESKSIWILHTVPSELWKCKGTSRKQEKQFIYWVSRRHRLYIELEEAEQYSWRAPHQKSEYQSLMSCKKSFGGSRASLVQKAQPYRILHITIRREGPFDYHPMLTTFSKISYPKTGPGILFDSLQASWNSSRQE